MNFKVHNSKIKLNCFTKVFITSKTLLKLCFLCQFHNFISVLDSTTLFPFNRYYNAPENSGKLSHNIVTGEWGDQEVFIKVLASLPWKVPIKLCIWSSVNLYQFCWTMSIIMTFIVNQTVTIYSMLIKYQSDIRFN